MIEILPNWHPAFVHFTVALLTISTLLFIILRFVTGMSWALQVQSAAYLNLWLGAGLTVLTVLAGFYAYGTVDHDDPSHAAMTDHRNWALVTAAFFWGLAIWAGRARQKGVGVSAGFLVLLVIATGLLGTTGWKGGELVYRYGLGVMSLPQPTGDGHDHEHGGDADHATSPEIDDDHDDSGHGNDVGGAPETIGHDDGDQHGDAITAQSQPRQSGHAHPEPSDENLTAFYTAFQDALASGDFETVAASFASDARIFEGGKAEADLEGYLENHLKPEMPVIQRLNREVLSQAFRRRGGMGWLSTAARIWGSIDGRDIDLSHVETMNLVFDHDNWRIAHVHWSSRPNKKN